MNENFFQALYAARQMESVHLGFEVNGGDAIATLEKIEKAMHVFGGKAVEDIFFEGAVIYRDAAKKEAPLGPTGNLREGIVAKRLLPRTPKEGTFASGTMRVAALAGRNYWKAPHFHLIEAGTRRGIKPNPFFARAVGREEARVNALIDNRLDALWNKELRNKGLT